MLSQAADDSENSNVEEEAMVIEMVNPDLGTAVLEDVESIFKTIQMEIAQISC